MKSAIEIIQEAKTLIYPNEGIKRLAKEAYDDPDWFCIMDSDGYLTSSYREECPDRGICHRPDFMLVCVATRWKNDQIGELAIKIYNGEK